jgi:broad specificity phosphatase PhoE
MSDKRPDAILVRHFASPLNEKKVSRGWLSVGIDRDLAKKLVPDVAATLKKYDVDTLVSSDLPRAEQSAKMIADEMGLDATETTRALRTWDVGDMAGKKESITVPLRQKFIKYPDEVPKGGEAFQEFLDRYRDELEDIVDRRADGEQVAMVAHGHQLLAGPHILQDEEVDAKKLPSLDEDYTPGSVYLFFVEGDKVRIECADDESKETQNEKASRAS